MKKAQVINLIADKMAHPETVLTGTVTADGSSTLYHPEYRQHFHSIAGAASEAEFKFVQPAGLDQLLTQHSQVHLLDIGFGLGYNSFAAVKCAVKQAAGKLSVTALELDQRVVRAAGTIPGRDSLEQEILQHLTENNYWQNQYASITLLLGDARTAINTINEPFDFIFLDAFSPETNPELWTSDFFRRLKLLLKPEGMLLTYSSAYPVRGALLKAGFQCSETPAFGRRRGGTAATLTKNQTLPPLPQKEINIIMKSTAGVPYRDPGLKHNRKWIIEHHHHIVKKLRAHGIPKWAAPQNKK
jgi:tRNA U34 5-methylaminomethyl-2-thiouridine-forming methyltransferase MnmC